MLESSIKLINGKSYICINEEIYVPYAYTTYFEECGKYSDFTENGYRMFFVNVSFSDLPINNVTGFTPFLTGVFEKDEPDYTEFDATVRKILSICPNAFIFPRINITMPRSWIQAHTSETVSTLNGGRRESLYSDAFLRDGAVFLCALLEHIKASDYARRVAGYQLCGGTTQEWIHHDLFGSFSENGIRKFRLWLKEKYGNDSAYDLSKDSFNSVSYNEAVSRYGEFCGEMTAKTVEYFSETVKENTGHKQIVGVFYGYNAFVNDYLWGLHGLRFIIDSPYIDFFSSPCCYDKNREPGIHWGDMLTSESVKAHGKLYFVECDIRTHLTRRMQDSRPGRYSDNAYALYDADGNKTVWCGPDTAELSLAAIRKVFAHHLTKSNGIWWFDMWGGWYDDTKILSEMKKMKEIAELSAEKNPELFPTPQTVVFIDERAYLNNPRNSVLCNCVNNTRVAMGNTGIPFDLCMTEDAEKVLHKYKAAIFTAPIPSESGKAAVNICEKLKIPYLQPDTEKSWFSTDELREFLVLSEVHCYNADGHVVYCGGGYVGVHAAKEGNIKITLPEKYNVRLLFGAGLSECETDSFSVNMKKYDTLIFELN